MAKIIQTSRSGFSRLFAGFRQRYPYRWYEVEVACFSPTKSLIAFSEAQARSRRSYKLSHDCRSALQRNPF